MSGQNEQRRYLGLQALRAIAAFMVLVQHSVIIASRTVDAGDMMTFRKLGLGTIGVYLFFTISGFVMALSSNTTAKRFSVHRIARIYPAYFAASLLGAAALLVSGAIGFGSIHINASFFLLPSSQVISPFSVPFWTLIYEVFFYAVLALMLASGLSSTTRAAMMTAWATAIVAYAGIAGMPSIPKPGILILFSAANVYFIAGYALSWAMTHNRPAAFVAPMLVIFAGQAFAAPGLAGATLYLPLCAATVFLAARVEVMKLGAVTVQLGDYSYGLYLLHLPLMVAVSATLKNSGLSFVAIAWIMFLLCGTSAMAFGWLDHKVYKSTLKPAADRISSMNLFPAWVKQPHRPKQLPAQRSEG